MQTIYRVPAIDTEVQEAEEVFARWVYRHNCQVVATKEEMTEDVSDSHLLSCWTLLDEDETSMVRAIIIHGYMAGQSEDRGCVNNSRDRLVSGLHPLEAFKRAIGIGIAAKLRYDAQGIPITKPFDRAAPPVEWLPADAPDTIPYYLPAPRSSCDFVELKPTAIYRSFDVFDVSRSLQGTSNSATPLREEELIWDCSCGQVWYEWSSFIVVDNRDIGLRSFRIGPIPPTLRPYAVLNPISGVPYQSKYGVRTDLRALAAQLSKEDEEDDGPLLVTWSCLHGDLYVRGALDQIPLAPTGCVLDTLKSLARPTAPLPPSPRQHTGRSSYPRSSGIPSSSTSVPKKRKRVDSDPTPPGPLHSTRTTTSAPHPPDDSSVECNIDGCDIQISRTTWEVHLSTAHRISQPRWRSGARCPHDCRDPKKQHAAATYDSWATFKRHFKQKHTGEPDSVTVVCPEAGCKQRGLSRPDALLRHYQKTHPGLAPPRERRRGAGAASGGNNNKENESPAPPRTRTRRRTVTRSAGVG
ncbi:hypothetical protein C8Q74DRAFT_989585 [Fomes fomentarius]|nr:hypothetical protein C8Q74DRAFT_989585 [Fomes fomentarius]